MGRSSGSTSGIRRSKRSAPSHWRWAIFCLGGRESLTTWGGQAVPQPPEGASCNRALWEGFLEQCPLRACSHSASLEGDILKPAALRVVGDCDNAQGRVPVTMPRVWGSVVVPCAHARGGVLLSGAASPGEGARAARACGQPRSSVCRSSAMSARSHACVTPPGERLASRDRSSPGHRHA